MGLRYVVLGAGRQGIACAYDLAFDERVDEVVLADFDMLKAGGSKHHSELLKPFGLDASDPAFWDMGLGVIDGLITELEDLEKHE